MANTYSVSKIVGTSKKSIEDAIETAVETAGQSLKNLDWFEVVSTRGYIEDGKVSYYQVTIEIGFRYDKKA